MNNKIIGIVAMDRNGVIAVNGNLPHKSKNDMNFFKEMTTGNNVIMGRKTFDTLTKPLPNRKNIVITRQELDTPYKEVYYTNSYLGALRSITHENTRDIFIIGGAQIYRDMLPLCDEVYVTVFNSGYMYPVDDVTFFPYHLDDEYGNEIVSSLSNSPLNNYFEYMHEAMRFVEDDGLSGSIYKLEKF
jgi:dihydrofolate reductase